ncbi:MAG TPA: hypothetical protein VIV60_33000 [Polyangiaceae bacterium]
MFDRLRILCRLMPLLACVAVATVGCGHEATPMQVRFADFGTGVLKHYDGTRPLIVEFQPGERLPLDFHFRVEGFELDPQHPPLEVVVKQHCYVRINSEGLRISLDGQHFDKPRQPGSFQIGFEEHRGQPAKVTLALEGPRH